MPTALPENPASLSADRPSIFVIPVESRAYTDPLYSTVSMRVFESTPGISTISVNPRILFAVYMAADV